MNYDSLKLENQVCFPLYVCAKEVINKYRPLLDRFDLTYTQYITMMVLWETSPIISKELCRKLYLDSGTLTPLLKKLESKGYITRCRDNDDERNLVVCITEKGMALRDEIISVPESVRSCIPVADEDLQQLYVILYRILEKL
ncbi:MAG: MarR family transcriptional regulator [Clostridia bacterium]|nr:MarR family transcriptional regulator [Clostridia bacterium]